MVAPDGSVYNGGNDIGISRLQGPGTWSVDHIQIPLRIDVPDRLVERVIGRGIRSGLARIYAV